MFLSNWTRAATKSEASVLRMQGSVGSKWVMIKAVVNASFGVAKSILAVGVQANLTSFLSRLVMGVISRK